MTTNPSASERAVEAARRAKCLYYGQHGCLDDDDGEGTLMHPECAMAAAKEELTRCPTCKGSGRLELAAEDDSHECDTDRCCDCPDCKGTGTIPTSWDLESDEVVVW